MTQSTSRPMRIVSLLPSVTEILFALGAGDDVVGVTFECTYPSQARTRRVVSTSALPEGLSPAEIDAVVSERMASGEDLYRLDAGALADLEADLIITQDLCQVCALDTDDVQQALEHLGSSAQVLTADPHSLQDVLSSIRAIAHAVGRDPEPLLRSLYGRLDAVRSSAAREHKRVVLLEWTDPPYAPGHWVPDMITTAGGTCLLGSTGQRSERTTWEQVRAADPEIVLVAPCGYGLEASAKQAEGLPDLPGEIWALDADGYVVRPGPRLVDGVEAIAAVLWGEQPDPRIARRLA